MVNNYQRWKGIMKAYPFEEKRLAKWTPPYIVQPKYDGVRCRVVPVNSTGACGASSDTKYILLSSEENVFFSVPHLNELFNRINLGQELDGELYCHGMSFEQIVSITSRTNNLHPDHKLIQFHCFDIIGNAPQMRRTLIIENLRSRNHWLQVAPYFLCETLDEVTNAYDAYLAQGYEGIIVRQKDAFYECKRSTSVMKFKPKQEDMYTIVGVQEEVDKEGNPKDRLGALVCQSGDGNTFNVGTGFTALNRDWMWNNRFAVIGKQARVRYQHITSGNKVPRFPVFVEVINELEREST